MAIFEYRFYLFTQTHNAYNMYLIHNNEFPNHRHLYLVNIITQTSIRTKHVERVFSEYKLWKRFKQM